MSKQLGRGRSLDVQRTTLARMFCCCIPFSHDIAKPAQGGAHGSVSFGLDARCFRGFRIAPGLLHIINLEPFLRTPAPGFWPPRSCPAERDPELRLSERLAEPGQEAFERAPEGHHRGEGGAGEHGRGELSRVPLSGLLVVYFWSSHVGPPRFSVPSLLAEKPVFGWALWGPTWADHESRNVCAS